MCSDQKPSLREALKFLTEYTAAEVRQMVANPAEHVAFALVLNRRKSLDMFVCELAPRVMCDAL